MIQVGWLQDDPGYQGGAELTALELRQAAPDGVEIVDVMPDSVTEGLDVYVVHNCTQYTQGDSIRLDSQKVIRFVHDLRGPGPIDSPHRIFYSALQRDHLKLDGELCPAPLDATRFHPNGDERDGSVHIGTFGHMGKGQHLLGEWAARNGPLTVYGHGPFPPAGANIDFRGEITHEQTPRVLQHAQRFVHLPATVEGYGRGVAEAWACGCELVVNHNVGCLEWIRHKPDMLETAAERFWTIVLNT